MSFKSFSKLTLVSIFLIIVAGSLVRMTGSGMGCPDWPKCFGYLIPPTSEDQIKWGAEKTFFEGQMIIYDDQLWSANYDFVSTDVYNKTNWTIYTNISRFVRSAESLAHVDQNRGSALPRPVQILIFR